MAAECAGPGHTAQLCAERDESRALHIDPEAIHHPVHESGALIEMRKDGHGRAPKVGLEPAERCRLAKVCPLGQKAGHLTTGPALACQARHFR